MPAGELPWASEVQEKLSKKEALEPNKNDIDSWKDELQSLIEKLPGFIVKTLHTQQEKDSVLAEFRDAVDNGKYSEALEVFNNRTVPEIELEAKDTGRVLDNKFNAIRELLIKLAKYKNNTNK